MHRPPQARAFTLVELLIVISIVAILAALSWPVLGRMLQSGKEAKGVAAMRNVLRHANLAQTDGGGLFYRKKVPGLPRLYWLQYFITDHANFDPQALRSPFDVDWEERLKIVSWALPPSTNRTALSYAMNMSLPSVFPDQAREPSIFRINTMVVQQPSRAALFIECLGTLGGFLRDKSWQEHVRFAFKGGEGVAVGFLDSHVEVVARSDLLDTDGSSWTEADRNLFWTGRPD